MQKAECRNAEWILPWKAGSPKFRRICRGGLWPPAAVLNRAAEGRPYTLHSVSSHLFITNRH